MIVLRLLLRWVTRVIYVVFGLAVLYFPAATLARRIARETDLFHFENIFPRYGVEDALLPGLVLALLYAAVMAVRRRIEPLGTPGHKEKQAVENASLQQPEHE